MSSRSRHIKRRKKKERKREDNIIIEEEERERIIYLFFIIIILLIIIYKTMEKARTIEEARSHRGVPKAPRGSQRNCTSTNRVVRLLKDAIRSNLVHRRGEKGCEEILLPYGRQVPCYMFVLR